MTKIDEVIQFIKKWKGDIISENTIILVSEFLEQLPSKYIKLLDIDDIIVCSHGTVRIEWEYDKYFTSIELGENGSGFYSDLPDGTEPYADNLRNYKFFIISLNVLYSTD